MIVFFSKIKGQFVMNLIKKYGKGIDKIHYN